MAGGKEAGVRESWIQTLVLVQSIRRFARSLFDNPVLVLVPDAGNCQAPDIQSQVEALGAQVLPITVDQRALNFRFAAKTFSAGVAEEHAEDLASALMWMDPDTLILQDPEILLPDPHTDLCYRPVHIINIGSRFDEPVDAFWQTIYAHCEASSDVLFPMYTCVRRDKIRPYINAGSLVVRPKRGLLRAWAKRLSRLYNDPVMQPFYLKSSLYEIFVHQAVLSGVVMATIERSRMRELPEFANYPTHLHSDYIRERRPKRLNDLITCRYEHPFEAVNWNEIIPVDEPIKSWIDQQRKSIQPLLQK
jgi:hypothetical protein